MSEDHSTNEESCSVKEKKGKKNKKKNGKKKTKKNKKKGQFLKVEKEEGDDESSHEEISISIAIAEKKTQKLSIIIEEAPFGEVSFSFFFQCVVKFYVHTRIWNFINGPSILSLSPL